MENKRRKTVKAFLLVGLTVCLITIGQAYVQSIQHRVQQEVLREMIVEKNVEYSAGDVGVQKEISVSVLENQRERDAENSGEETAGEPDAENVGGEMAGEPDAESGGETADEPQIMERYADLYEENQDIAGWLYVKAQADLDAGTNFIIYGHNMKDGSMFGELSLYDTGVEAELGDSFLTLSTCAYHVQGGRLVVVAKRRE